MSDEPQQPRKEARFNDVMLNIGANPRVPLDDGIAPVIVDGVPIESLIYFKCEAGADLITTVTLQFHANVTGNIAGTSVGELIKGNAN